MHVFEMWEEARVTKFWTANPTYPTKDLLALMQQHLSWHHNAIHWQSRSQGILILQWCYLFHNGTWELFPLKKHEQTLYHKHQHYFVRLNKSSMGTMRTAGFDVMSAHMHRSLTHTNLYTGQCSVLVSPKDQIVGLNVYDTQNHVFPPALH